MSFRSEPRGVSILGLLSLACGALGNVVFWAPYTWTTNVLVWPDSILAVDELQVVLLVSAIAVLLGGWAASSGDKVWGGIGLLLGLFGAGSVLVSLLA